MQLNAKSTEIPLQVEYVDPSLGHDGPHRGPVLVPDLSIDDYTLSFSTPCYGYTLELIDGNDAVAYTTVITSDSLVLPSTLSGDYELRLYPAGSSIYFYGYVLF